MNHNSKPIVGIFYFLKDRKDQQLISQIVPVDFLAKPFESYNAGYHVDLWHSISEKYGYPPDMHEYFPRGRVNYMIDYLEVIVDKCLLKNKKFKDQIKKDFPYKKHVFIGERKAHYSCYKCNPIQ